MWSENIVLYKPLGRSQLEYASQVWSPHTKENITTLERVQRRATKFSLKTDVCYPERLVKLKRLPLEYRREILDLRFYFKCLKGYINFDVLSHVNFKTPKYNLRNVVKLCWWRAFLKPMFLSFLFLIIS